MLFILGFAYGVIPLIFEIYEKSGEVVCYLFVSGIISIILRSILVLLFVVIFIYQVYIIIKIYKQKLTENKVILLYPICYLFCWAPVAIDEIYTLIYHEDIGVVFNAIGLILRYLHGLFNVIIYLLITH